MPTTLIIIHRKQANRMTARVIFGWPSSYMSLARTQHS